MTKDWSQRRERTVLASMEILWCRWWSETEGQWVVVVEPRSFVRSREGRSTYCVPPMGKGLDQPKHYTWYTYQTGDRGRKRERGRSVSVSLPTRYGPRVLAKHPVQQNGFR